MAHAQAGEAQVDRQEAPAQQVAERRPAVQRAVRRVDAVGALRLGRQREQRRLARRGNLRGAARRLSGVRQAGFHRAGPAAPPEAGTSPAASYGIARACVRGASKTEAAALAPLAEQAVRLQRLAMQPKPESLETLVSQVTDLTQLKICSAMLASCDRATHLNGTLVGCANPLLRQSRATRIQHA